MTKAFLKGLANLAAAAAVTPPVLLYRAAARLAGPEAAFPGWSQAFALLPGLSGVYLRRAFYRRVLARFGGDACVEFGTVFSHPSADVGRGVYIGPYCVIGAVTIGDDVLLASHVSVLNGGRQHGIERLDVPIREQPGVWPRVTVGRDSWVGERSVVMADVGEQTVVGAGSVVVRPLGSRVVAAGAPARVLKPRDGAGPAGACREGCRCESCATSSTTPGASG
jgi:acetyltransferase-like isoleucine patch superfamily enzyme